MTLVACIGGGQLGRMLGLAGLPLGDWYPELEDALLLCTTEVHDLDAMDRLVRALTSSGVEAA
mgnify:CR=1 FL=1